MVRFRLLCGDFLLPNPALNLENRKTVCMGYPAMTPKGSTDDCANRRSKEEVLAQCSNFCKQANSAPQKLAKHKRRAGKRRRKGAGNPCRENGAPNINWSNWPVDVVNLKLTRHNGRAGTHGTYNPKHNDRSFNLANSEHIDPERAKGNIYWDCPSNK